MCTVVVECVCSGTERNSVACKSIKTSTMPKVASLWDREFLSNIPIFTAPQTVAFVCNDDGELISS